MLDINKDSLNKKKGLGRGLGSLLNVQNDEAEKPQTVKSEAPPISAAPINSEDRVWKVPVEKLKPGQYQPRQEFTKAFFCELLPRLILARF